MRSSDDDKESCSYVKFESYNNREHNPMHIELQFDAPPLPDEVEATSWDLLVKLITGHYPNDTCHYPGLTIFINSPKSTYAFTACPRDATLGGCVFRCSGYEGQKTITYGQGNTNVPSSGAQFFMRLEVPVNGEWYLPTRICELDTVWVNENAYFKK